MRAVVLVVGVAGAREADAQGTVHGSLTLLERAGAAVRDVGSAVVYLEPTPRAAPPARGMPADVSIDMRHREFEPHVRFVRVGGTVAFPNSDPFSHNVFSNTALGAFDLGLYRAGVTRTYTFPRAGVYAIYCNIHARMVSFVVAVTTPYVAIATNDGKFAIPGVAAGTYRLHAWHERTSDFTQEILVGASGATGVAVTLDARGYVAKPHPNKFGAPYAMTRADRY